MTHPKARTRRRARDARASPKRYRLTLLGTALLEARDARDRALDAAAIARSANPELARRVRETDALLTHAWALAAALAHKST